jgi:hypothetical protein
MICRIMAQMDCKQYPPGDGRRKKTKKVRPGAAGRRRPWCLRSWRDRVSLYESGMECAIVSGASSGALNAVALAGAKGYPPTVLRTLCDKLVVEAPLPSSRPW